MVLPFLALAGMAVGGVMSAVGRQQSASQAKRADEEDRRAGAAAQKDLAEKSVAASKIPLVVEGNLSKLVAESEAAGFNPLSVLRAGGMSFFNTTTGHNAHLAAVTPLYSRGMTSSISPSGEFMQGLGSAVSNVAGAGLQHAQHTQSLQTQMATSAMAYSGAQSNWAGARFNGASEFGSRFAVGGGWNPEAPAPNEPMRVFGVDIEGHPGMSPAGVITENWGEPAEWFYALPKIGADLFHTGMQTEPAKAAVNFMTQSRDVAGMDRAIDSMILDFARHLDQRQSKTVGPDGTVYLTGGGF